MTDRELLEAILGKIAGMETSMATKEELTEIRTNMATKDELAEVRTNMATKEELTEIRTNMATKEELAEVRTNMATKGELTEIRTNMATKGELAGVENDLKFVKETVIRIENDHGQKLGALFDGYRLISEKIDRIEEEVAKHEEIILRRIR